MEGWKRGRGGRGRKRKGRGSPHEKKKHFEVWEGVRKV